MKTKKTAYPYLLWMLLFTIVPIGMVTYYAFTDEQGNFTFEMFVNASDYSQVFLYSLWIALISTFICLVLAYPLSFMISRCEEHKQSMIIMFIIGLDFYVPLKRMSWVAMQILC